MKNKSLLPRGMRGTNAEGGMDPAVSAPKEGSGVLTGAPQCPSPSAESSEERQRTGDNGGDAKRAESSASTSSAAPSPAAPTGPQLLSGKDYSHLRCGWCNAVLEGDPKTIARDGAVVSAGCCASCQTDAIECHDAPEVPPTPNFARVFLNGAAIRHFEQAKKLRGLGLAGLADHEEETARRMQQEAEALSQ